MVPCGNYKMVTCQMCGPHHVMLIVALSPQTTSSKVVIVLDFEVITLEQSSTTDFLAHQVQVSTRDS